MEEDHLTTQISQKALFRDGDKILIVHDNEGMWELPGGRVHTNEELIDGLKREIHEELCVDVDVQKVQDVFLGVTRSGSVKLIVVYSCVIHPGQVIHPDPHEILDFRWIPVAELGTIKTYEAYKKFFKTL